MDAFIPLYVLSLLGVGFSVYLSRRQSHHAKGVRSPKTWCDLNDKVSCEKVISGHYSTLFGIKVAYLGLIFFVLMTTLVAATSYLSLPFIYIEGLGTIGILFSFYLIYIEVFKIGAICPLCFTAYIFDWLIVLLLLLNLA